MTRGIGPGVLMALLAVAPVSGDYRSQVREWEAYAPPPVYPAPPASGPDVRAEGAGEFRLEAARLREAGARWERAVEEAAPGEAFWVPDPEGVARLGAAREDPAAAKRALADGFGVEALAILALLRSPVVAAREADARAAAAAYGQVASLDEVLRQYAVFTAALAPGIGAAESAEGIEARFPFPGVLALKGRIAEREVREAWEALQAARRDAVTEARRIWWELGYLYRAREITAEMLVLLDHLKDAASARYAAGENAFQDVVKVGIEREKATEELATLGQEVLNAEARLRNLLGLRPGASVGRPAAGSDAPPVPDLQRLYPLASERRQELRRLRAAVERVEAMVEMAETMVYPRFHLDLSSYGRDEVSAVVAPGAQAGGGGGFPESTEAGMGSGLPRMPWYGTRDAYLQETRQRLNALRKDLEAEEAATALRVREAWFRLDRAAREQALFEDRVLALAEAALEASTQGYAAGTLLFTDVIGSYRSWFEAKLALERRRADRGIAAAETEAAVGVSPLPVAGGE